MINTSLLDSALRDSDLSIEQLALQVNIEAAVLEELRQGKVSSTLTVSGLLSIEKALNLPENSLLLNSGVHPVHRTVIYQNFITPRGLYAWVETLRKYAEVHLIPDEDGITDSHALSKLREKLELEVKNRTLLLYAQGQITQGRAREILGLSPFDKLD